MVPVYLCSCQAGVYCVAVTQAGPPTVADTIAQRVRKFRLRRDWSVRELAEECANLGAPQLTAASLANIERGQDPNAKRKRRDVTVEELVILGYALQVPPILLMVPLGDADEVELVPGVAVHPYDAALWISGRWNRGDGWGGVPGLDHLGRGGPDALRPAPLPEALDFALLPGFIYEELSKVLALLRHTGPFIPPLATEPLKEYEQILAEQGHIPDEAAARRHANITHYLQDLVRFADVLLRGEAAGIKLPPVPRRIYADLQWLAANMQTSRPTSDADAIRMIPVRLPRGLRVADEPEEQA
jgi:transcriptional regulator with XRE-family HTH domain